MNGRRRDDGVPALAVGVVAAAGWWRRELALLALAAAVYWLRAGALGALLAGTAVLMVAVALVAVPFDRRPLASGLRRAWVWRSWARATLDSGLADGPLRVP